jgi:prepilin peptidase CpaA
VKLAAEAPLWLALIFAVLLVAGAGEDSARLRISNLTCLLILVGAIVAAAILGPELAVWQNLVVFGILLGLGTPLFAAGKLGGGDVKLLAASGLWFDLEGGVLMLVTVLLAGGVLALVVIALRTIGWSEAARGRIQLLRPGAGVPYGVAIAVGTLITTAMLRA